MKKKLRFRRKGTLQIIAGLLIASAILRVGSDAGQAFAESVASAPQQNATSSQPSAVSQEQGALLEAILERESVVERREKAVKDQLEAIAIAETRIAEQLAALEKAEEDLRATMALAETAAEDDLTRLTTVYENMKPKETAALFEEMAPEFSAGFLGRMRPDAAALVMTQLTPQTAYSISVILAGRNANVPTE